MIKAIITSVVPNGAHGPYAAAAIKEGRATDQFCTIDLNKDAGVWQHDVWPKAGDGVMLSPVEHSGQWRAITARFVTPNCN